MFLDMYVIWGISVISSRGDNEKVATPTDDDNQGDAGFNDGGVMFIYLPNLLVTLT